ncbi:Kringle-like protein, partial [Pavlovales sp. CCMP2436]
YRGAMNHTALGDTCQAWSSQTPHSHAFTAVTHPGQGLEDGNFCRKPSGAHLACAWCYTTREKPSWGCCMPEAPPAPPAAAAKPATATRRAGDYRGHVSTTVSGHSCQRWDAQAPNAHPYAPLASFAAQGLGAHSECRRPGGFPCAWCYTLQPTKRGWECCD